MYRIYLQLCINASTIEMANTTYSYIINALESNYTINKRLGHNEKENMYRIFIDIPIDAVSVEDAVLQGNKIIELFIKDDKFTETFTGIGLTRLNYRLGNDEDRQKSNYFLMNENGHVSTKKSAVNLGHARNESADM